MNLPFILDVAIGLIFVYLILSLLASEIQELIAALLQWRAKHLRESITNLLQGGQKPPNNKQDQVKKLVKKIYDDPLIRNINQEAVRGIEKLLRQLTWRLADVWGYFARNWFRQENRERAFVDHRSAPSYIPAETFATTLIESVGISDLSKLLMQQRLNKFTEERLGRVINNTLEDVIKNSPEAKQRVSKFDGELKQIIESYKNSEATLQTCIVQIMESFDRLIAFFEHKHSTPEIRSELQAIKANYFGEKGERAFLFGLSPSSSELVELIDKGSRVYKEIEPAFKAAFNKNTEALAQKVEQEIVTLTAIANLNLSDSDKNTYESYRKSYRSCLALAQKVEQEIARLANRSSIAQITEQDRAKFASDAMANLNLSDSDKNTYESYRSCLALAQKVEQEIARLANRSSIAQITEQDRAKFASNAMANLNLSDSDKNTYESYKSSLAIAQKVEQEITRIKITEEDRDKFASDAMANLNLSDSDRNTYEIYRTYQKIDQVIEELPKFVRDSLKVLARRAESRIHQVGTQVQQVGNEVDQLRIEIEAWFDRSMDRASGVYKRNAKVFAIVLGFVLAAATNSDTFHIFSRISDDEKLRQVIVQNATSISQNSNPQQPDYDAIRRKADEALKAIPLPIGWNPTIVKQQLNCNQQVNDRQVNNWASMNNTCNRVRNPFRDKSKPVKSFFIPGVIIGAMLSSFGNGAAMLVGWLVSGIAIAMGAPFWFDLLSKVVNVRNTGKPPKSSTTNQTTSSSQPNAPGS